MAISSAPGPSSGSGGLEAFQKLRASALQKIDKPVSPFKPTAPVKPEVAAKVHPQDGFVAAKARALEVAASLQNYQKTGVIDKAEKRPRLGQYVDLVA
jgi:hypothetical protein